MSDRPGSQEDDFHVKVLRMSQFRVDIIRRDFPPPLATIQFVASTSGEVEGEE